MGRWVRAAKASEIPPGEGRNVRVERHEIALFHDAEHGFFAIDDTCPHQGASLGEGTYHEGRVICPMHNWVFDVRTGACLVVPEDSVACYATRRNGDDVEIELPGGSDAGQASA
jgi:NAD(P)H-dependent nitrite reductase small subunit